MFMPESRQEQEQISATLCSVVEQLNKENVRLEKLHAQKLGLMQDLLTGKVPVRVDETQTEAT
jgi:type I restriction enzyme S subunit